MTVTGSNLLGGTGRRCLNSLATLMGRTEYSNLQHTILAKLDYTRERSLTGSNLLGGTGRRCLNSLATLMGRSEYSNLQHTILAKLDYTRERSLTGSNLLGGTGRQSQLKTFNDVVEPLRRHGTAVSQLIGNTDEQD
ncbi:hypothetical protein J6590_053905 [Homalodisca vitripennis]|nr:hypothetical protein J6590_053905 [Homalodisca vitripennis]